MSASTPDQPRERKRKARLPCLAQTGIVVLIGLFVCFIALGPLGHAAHFAQHNYAMQQGRQIGQCMFSYATDNVANGNTYPDGKSSTEVFQKLLDGGYVTDPTLFYVPMPGKIRPDPNQKKLKPENVSWDITGGVDSSSQDVVPLVFLTGWKVNYVPGGAVTPLIKPYPGWTLDDRDVALSWWPFDWPRSYEVVGMAIFYKGNNARFTLLKTTPEGDGTIPNFIPSTFKPDGHTYRQLTPEGVLP